MLYHQYTWFLTNIIGLFTHALPTMLCECDNRNDIYKVYVGNNYTVVHILCSILDRGIHNIGVASHRKIGDHNTMLYGKLELAL